MRLQLLGIITLSALTACSSSSGSDDEKAPQTNTLTSASLSTKINDGSSIYSGMANLRQSFGSGAAKTFAPSQLKGLRSFFEEPSDDEEISAMSYLPSTTAVTDCASGFDMFESMFAQAKSDYEDMAAGFSNPQSQADENTDVKEVTPAADEAVAYEFAPKQQMEGFSISGRFAGGGTDTVILLRNHIEMTMDYSKIFGGGQFPGGTLPDMDDSSDMPTADMGIMSTNMKNTVTVDLVAKLATSDVDMTMSQTQGGATHTQKVSGKIIVSNGDDKYVSQDLSIQSQSAEVQAFTTNMTARLVGTDTINITGSFQGPGAPGAVSVTIKKAADGTCSVDTSAP